jgi:hypothetical protein
MILESPTDLLNFSQLSLVGKPDKIENEWPLELSLEPVVKLRKKEYKKKLEEAIEFTIDLDLDIYGGLKVGNNNPTDDITTNLDPVYVEPDNWGPEDWPKYHDRCADVNCSKFLYHVGSYYEGVKVYKPDGLSLYKLFCVECWKERTLDDNKKKNKNKNKTNPKDETRANQKTNPKHEKRRQALIASLHAKMNRGVVQE